VTIDPSQLEIPVPPGQWSDAGTLPGGVLDNLELIYGRLNKDASSEEQDRNLTATRCHLKLKVGLVAVIVYERLAESARA